jgi:hypothetical protein
MSGFHLGSIYQRLLSQNGQLVGRPRLQYQHHLWHLLVPFDFPIRFSKRFAEGIRVPLMHKRGQL